MNRTQNCICNPNYKFFKQTKKTRYNKCWSSKYETQIGKSTSLVNDVEGAVDDVVEFESVICIREALEIKGVVLDK